MRTNTGGSSSRCTVSASAGTENEFRMRQRMSLNRRKPRTFLVLSALGLIAGLAPRAGAQPASPAVDPPSMRSKSVGDEACIPCHQGKTDTYHHTAHYFTSRPAAKETILGSFNPGANILRTVDTNLFFEMQSTADGFFQKAVRRVSPTVVGHRAERLDVVIGSGRKGQTYLFWKQDRLFELPVSYWTELNEWVNSPGYPDGAAYFDRPVSPRCLECHASGFESLPPPENRFQPRTIVFGITCEKCHGPGGEHVARYRSASPPKSRASSAILNPASFSRDRQI